MEMSSGKVMILLVSISLLFLPLMNAVPLDTTTSGSGTSTSSTTGVTTETTSTTPSSDESTDNSDEVIIIPQTIVQQFRIVEIITNNGTSTTARSSLPSAITTFKASR